MSESSYERGLRARGIPITELEFGREEEPAVIGIAVLRPCVEGWEVNLHVRPGLSTPARAAFAEWASSRLDRFFEHGSEPDGWQKRKSDDGWQLWVRQIELPSLD